MRVLPDRMWDLSRPVAGKVIVEELHVPDELLGRRAFLTAFPILPAGCGGAPARAVAWEIEE